LITSTGYPAPSLHPHYRDFTATTGRSAGVPRNQGCTLSHRPQPAAARVGGAPSHVPSGSSRSGSRRLHAGHRLANQRAPARLIPEHSPNTPVLMSSVFVTTRQQRFACARLPDPHLTPHKMPFPRSLTTTVFSQRSTEWFGALPRRTTPEGQQASISSTAPPMNDVSYTTPPSAFVTHGCRINRERGAEARFPATDLPRRPPASR